MTVICRGFSSASVAVALVLCLPLAGVARTGGSAATEDKAAAEAKQQLKRLTSKLQVIQTSVMKASKKLQRQQKELRDLLSAKMTKLGKDPAVESKRLKQMYTEMTQKKGTAEEVSRRMAEFQQARQALEEVRRKAMQDKQVKQATKAFQKALEAAMIKKDPGAKKMLKQYDALLNKLRGQKGSAG